MTVSLGGHLRLYSVIDVFVGVAVTDQESDARRSGSIRPSGQTAIGPAPELNGSRSRVNLL